ncbi:hypothetical protein [Brumimicrobium aurantiacum]|uniref:Outer membrane protein beta-barrel domain-containing protein n=1 Tax=Brumimicrobium aurantiacum TaxID=1737063 RepID=A0A3E1F1I5_9FLAO|nr:hypothetical protein [Brumimicrobium aurantiacum]RFC55670.1 hypothetical protein DXU93_01680 [Brumimicrobium aurantiacum]
MINSKYLLFVLCSILYDLSGVHAQIKTTISEKVTNYFSTDKIQERTNKRYIEPGTHILTLALSNNRYPLIIKDPSALLDSEIITEFSNPARKLADALYINYQYSLPKNFFVEAGFKYLKHWTYFKTNDWAISMETDISSFSTLSFSLGSGYRFVGENNLRFFDVHAGVTLGITDNPVGNGGSFSRSFEYTDYNGNTGMFSYNLQYQITSRYSLGFYLGLSKDIRVTKNLYLTARYHYQFGENSELTGHTISYSLPTLGLYDTVKASNTAKGQMLALGLRWMFLGD